MAFTEDLLENASGTTLLGVGLGVVFLGPVLVPAVGRGLRPIAKGAIKGCLSLADRTREMFAETGERLQDLYAEAVSEHANANGTAPPDEESAGRRHRSRRAAGEARSEPA